MPTYQYECEACNYTFEKFQSIGDKRLVECPKCHRPDLYRLIGTGSGIIFKGTGFYETDYKRKPSAEGAGTCKDGAKECACQPAAEKPAVDKS